MDLEARKAAILLADVEERRRKALSYVPKSDVDAFAGLYAEADRMDDIAHVLRERGHPVPGYAFQREWLDEQLNIGSARDGWRSLQVVDVEKGAKELNEEPERRLSPGGGRGWS